MTQMSQVKSDKRDAENTILIRKVRSAGHWVEFSIRRDSKGLFSVSAIIHHKAGFGFDTAAYLAKFFNVASAKAYAAQMDVAA